MIDTNDKKIEEKTVKLSPLRADEINSVIKSFQETSFNKEELYSNENNLFVKKSLFELAKDSEKKQASKPKVEANEELVKKDIVNEDLGLTQKKENQLNVSESKNTEEVNTEKQISNDFNNYKNENILNEQDDNKLSEINDDKGELNNVNTDQVTQIDKNASLVEDINKSNSENSNDGLPNENQINEITNKDIKPNSVLGESRETKSENNDFENKTLDALDSVREAVSKSLDKNLENENQINEKFENNLKLNITDELNNLNKLLINIREISNKKIEEVIKLKVIELTEEVVGYKIEKFPEKYLKKIKSTIDEMKNLNENVKIILNPSDQEILKNFLNDKNFDFNYDLQIDSNLGRGDFTIDLGGLMHSIKYKKIVE